jgi:putative transposase
MDSATLRGTRRLSYADSHMTDFLLTLLHLAVVTAKLCGPGGVRAVIAENLVLKQQLIVLRRARRRSPNLTLSDRLLCGFESLFLSSGRIRKVAIALRPSTLLAFHQALVRRKYRRLFSSTRCPKQPGPKGPDKALIRAIVELKSRNPRFGCPRIARIVSETFGIDIDKNVVYRVLAKHQRPAPGGTGPSWLSFIGHTTDSLWSVDLFRCESIVLRSYWVLVVMDQYTRRLVGIGVHHSAVTGADLCRMFNAAIHGQGNRDISVPITIRCSKRIDGWRTCGFWRSTKSKPCRMYRCPTRSSSA